MIPLDRLDGPKMVTSGTTMWPTITAPSDSSSVSEGTRSRSRISVSGGARTTPSWLSPVVLP